VAVLASGKQALDETVAALLELGAFGIIEERCGILNALVNASGPVDVGVGRFALKVIADFGNSWRQVA
jgi:hypothetical protein